MLNRLQYNINIALTCTGKPKSSCSLPHSICRGGLETLLGILLRCVCHCSLILWTCLFGCFVGFHHVWPLVSGSFLPAECPQGPSMLSPVCPQLRGVLLWGQTFTYGWSLGLSPPFGRCGSRCCERGRVRVLLSVLQGEYLGVELLDDAVVLGLAFEGTVKLFYTVASPSYILQ